VLQVLVIVSLDIMDFIVVLLDVVMVNFVLLAMCWEC
jgi:hypothetical protein